MDRIREILIEEYNILQTEWTLKNVHSIFIYILRFSNSNFWKIYVYISNINFFLKPLP